MNEINSSKRLKYAVAERAEGDKILQVKSAEAEAEAKYLSGVGVAKQRKAIVDGLRTSIVDFSENIENTSTKEVMDLLLLTQYFDMVRGMYHSNIAVCFSVHRINNHLTMISFRRWFCQSLPNYFCSFQ